jgi:hypothetical protein
LGGVKVSLHALEAYAYRLKAMSVIGFGPDRSEMKQYSVFE